MCSVIEIKNNSEYYIHYHSPDSLEACTENMDEGSEDNDSMSTRTGSVDPGNPQQKDGKGQQKVDKDEPEEEKDRSVVEITHSPVLVVDKDPGKAEEITSDKGSSLDGTESGSSNSGGGGGGGGNPEKSATSGSRHVSDVPITVNSHIPNQAGSAYQRKMKESEDKGPLKTPEKKVSPPSKIPEKVVSKSLNSTPEKKAPFKTLSAPATDCSATESG